MPGTTKIKKIALMSDNTELKIIFSVYMFLPEDFNLVIARLVQVLNFFTNKELPKTDVSLITHPNAANAGVSIRELVKL